jgi:tRNA modification GTPase
VIQDTIAAISTALGQGAISIVRLSGADAFDIASRVVKNFHPQTLPSHTIHYGHIYEEDRHIDEVLVSVFKAPKSFTTEDMIEINTHGGTFVAQKVLELCLAQGARLALPGEFTQRAFLHGRIDLTQAESVLDMIESRSELSLTLANQGLEGKIYETIQAYRRSLLDIIAQIEVNIDYPEYDDVEEMTHTLILPHTQNLHTELTDLLKQAQLGNVIKEGVKTAIVGRPNVGKSSLLNALLREEKAIVTDIQGTTRDVVEGTLVVGGIVLRLMDTAGIRQTHDVIEQMGIDKSRKVVEEAQLVLVVLNQNEPLQDDDRVLLDMTQDKKRVIILNKSDLPKKIDEDIEDGIPLSALLKENLTALEKRIQELFFEGKIPDLSSLTLGNARHIGRIKTALHHLDQALNSAQNGMPVDMVELDLKEAWVVLGEIIGDSKDTALLDALFSQFCLGK